jgi:tetratricopeptide (TPR) repeat protein
MFKKASIALLIIVLFMISSIGFAGVRQNPEIIYELGIKAFQSHDYVKAIELMEGAIKLGLSGSKVDNAREIIKNSNRIKFMANKKDAALLDIALYLVDSVNVSNDGTRRKKADMELKVARYLISINKDKEAKDLISDALNLGRQIKEPSYSWLKAQIQADAAIAMLDLGDKNQALEITKSIETYYMKDIANKEIAILLSKKGKIPEAMEKINNIQSTLVTAEAFVGIAAELSKNGKKSEAFNFLKQAVETNKSKVIDRDKGQAYIVIAEGFRKTGKINEYEVNMIMLLND